MTRFPILVAVCLMLATPASAGVQQDTIHNQWMGDATCAGWRNAPRDFNSIQKSVLLNWVLGFLSGRAAERNDDILARVEVSSIAAWLDDYCAANPLDYLVTASFELEKALTRRREG